MDQLLQKAKSGDNDALSAIAAAYKPLVRAVANKFFLVGGDKDDLLQEGMIGLYKAVYDYEEDKGAFPAFVKLCVYRQVVSSVKQSASYKNRPLSNYVELSTIGDLAAGGDSPLDNVLDAEAYMAMQNVIDSQLTKTERQILMLFVEGYSYDEIVAATGKTYKAVDGALQRARKKLSAAKE
jgi:RNA polymerase sporulation-specific sigma factor